MKLVCFQLCNGLQLSVQYVPHCLSSVIHILYPVGSSYEVRGKTGIAHLLEHCMFGGTERVAKYDEFVHHLGGSSNAYTTTERTVYSLILPTSNLESGFFLESDRMASFVCNPSFFKIQKSVVIEEFKEYCYNRPYGMFFHHLFAKAYPNHSYGWPTIGEKLEDIKKLTVEDLLPFVDQYYRPANAKLSITTGCNVERAIQLAQKWFEPVTVANKNVNSTKRRKIEPIPPFKGGKWIIKEKSPTPLFAIAFPTIGRKSPDYFLYPLLATILGEGESSLLQQALIKEYGLCSHLLLYNIENLYSGILVLQAFSLKKNSLDQIEKIVEELLQKATQNYFTSRMIEEACYSLSTEEGLQERSLVEQNNQFVEALQLGKIDFFEEEKKRRGRVTVRRLEKELVRMIGRGKLTFHYL